MSERRSKYNARKTVIDGITFDSMAEAARYGELKLLQAAGEIRDLQVHPRYTIFRGYDAKMGRQEKIVYEADFQYLEDGQLVAEDVKGVETAVFRIKSKMFRVMFPSIDFRIIGGKK